MPTQMYSRLTRRTSSLGRGSLDSPERAYGLVVRAWLIVLSECCPAQPQLSLHHGEPDRCLPQQAEERDSGGKV